MTTYEMLGLKEKLDEAKYINIVERESGITHEWQQEDVDGVIQYLKKGPDGKIIGGMLWEKDGNLLAKYMKYPDGSLGWEMLRYTI